MRLTPVWLASTSHLRDLYRFLWTTNGLAGLFSSRDLNVHGEGKLCPPYHIHHIPQAALQWLHNKSPSTIYICLVYVRASCLQVQHEWMNTVTSRENNLCKVLSSQPSISPLLQMYQVYMPVHYRQVGNSSSQGVVSLGLRSRKRPEAPFFLFFSFSFCT